MAKDDSARRIMELFRGYEGAHGTHGLPVLDSGGMKWSIKTTAETRREPVTLAVWEQHLSGERPLGVIPIRKDNTCYWGSIDYDKYDVNLLELVRLAESSNLPLVPCRSKSGGLHLFLFMAEPQTAQALLNVLRECAARLGIAGSEIFPKQTRIVEERGDVGNWIVMPYFGGTYDGKLQEQVGLKKTGAEMTLREFLGVAEKSRVGGAAFAALGKKRVVVHGPKGGNFSDGPPCLQHMSNLGFPPGSRNNALLMIGIYLKRSKPSGWQRELEEMNGKFMTPPLSSDEVVSCIRSLEKKDYEYTCKIEPMVSHCDAAMCRTREHGVGDSGDFPRISGLSKLLTEPAIWFVDVDDHRLEVSTDDLLYYARFQKVCAEKLSRFYSNMKQSDWVRLLSSASSGLVEIAAPPDMGKSGHFHELLEEFLTNRSRGEKREDILLGKPWENEEVGRYYFMLSDLQEFITKEGVKEMSRNEIGRMITRMGGAAHPMNIKGRCKNTWFIPSELVNPAPEVEPNPVKGDPV